MSCLQQVLTAIAVLFLVDTVHTSPLFQGFSFNKGFEVNLKPFEFKPISFFKESWWPFGRFGVRKGIQKRDLGAMLRERLAPRPAVVPPAPVFEFPEETKQEEKKEEIKAAPEIQPVPEPAKPISSNLIRVPLTNSFKSPAEGLFTNIRRNPPGEVRPKVMELFGELPPRPVGPVPEPVESPPEPPKPVQQENQQPVQEVRPVPIQPVKPIPVQPVNPIPVQPLPIRPEIPEPRPVPIMFQPAGNPGPVEAPASQQVIPLITPPPPPVTPAPISEIPPTEGPFVRGSKVALYLGNVLIELVSQFLINARLQFSQFSKQAPPAQVPPLPVPVNK